MQAFAALQHAYSILQRQHHSSAPAPMSQTEAEQAAVSQHNRLLVQAWEIPPSCWYLLPPHLRASADTTPCSMPFLAFPLDAVSLQSPLRQPQGLSPSAAVANACSSADCALASGSACADATACGQHISACKAATSDAVLRGSSIEACCLAGSAGTACTVCTGADSPTLASGHLAQAVDSAACPAGIAGIACSSSPDSKLCTAGITPGSSTASSGHLGNALNPFSWQMQRHNPGQGQDSSQGHCVKQSRGQGQGQGQDVVAMALLVPCRKAMRDRFPLNGTFFQVNEVFLDNNTVERPLQVMPNVLPATGRIHPGSHLEH